MAKSKVDTSTEEPKQVKTIKISTLIISIAVLIGMIASFIGGIFAANNYSLTVKAQAVELSKEFASKTDEQ